MRTRNLILFVAVVLVLACALPVQAQINAGNGPGGSITVPVDFGTTGWYYDSGPGGGIYLDPNAGPLQKTLGLPPVNAQNPNGQFIVGQSYTLWENLLIAPYPGSQPPGPAWTDFHETITTPGWQWDTGNVWGCTSINPLGVAGNPLISPNFLNVDWTFTPAAPVGCTLTLTKYLKFIGGAGSNPLVQPIISEYPTPEPSTIVLLVVGAISAFGYGWYRRRRA